MTFQVPALLDALSTDANVLRQMIQLLASGAQGVSNDTDLKVTAGSGMVSNLAAGKGLINGTQNLVSQGAMTVLNDATVSQTHSAADGTNPRNDLVGVKIEDAFYSGSNKQATPVIVTGTPAASPADPATPANWLPLARVRVNAGASSLGTITDLRPKLGTPFKARAYAASTQSLTANIWGKVNLDTESYDPNNNFDPGAAHQYTVPVSGYYLVNGQVRVSAPGANVTIATAIGVNGVQVSYGNIEQATGTSSAIASSVSDIVKCVTGDTIALYANSNAGSALQIDAAGQDGYLSIHLLSL